MYQLEMLIFLFTFLSVLIILFLGKKVIYSAKRNLFKDQEVWSSKEIIIKHKNLNESKETVKKSNYLEMIADESKLYLDEQSNKEND